MELSELITDGSFVMGVLVAALGGVFSFVSPCVLPLLPGYLSLMSGYSVADLEAGELGRKRMLWVTLLFVAGFSIVFVLLGVAAAGVGRSLGPAIQRASTWAGWLVIVFGLVILVTALWNLPWLQNLMRDRRFHLRPGRFGWATPAVMGIAFGFGWTPCVGPILAAILAVAGSSGSVVGGAVLLGAFSLGLGIPFVLSGLGMAGLFRRLKKWLRPINIVSGLVLTAFGVIMVTGRVGLISGWFSELLIRIGLESITVV